MSIETERPNAYWLTTWLKSQRIRTVKQAAIALGRTSTRYKLRDIAELWSQTKEVLPAGINLVAGTGLRLDDNLTCPNFACRRQQVDVLFRHAWHYFDRVLLPDGVGDLLLHPPQAWNAKYFQERLLELIRVVLLIQQLGADSLVHYYPPIDTSSLNFDPILAEKRKIWNKSWRDVETTLITQGRYRFKHVGLRRFTVDCSDPFQSTECQVHLNLSKNEKETEDVLRSKAVHDILHSHIAEIETDLVTAQLLQGSLGSSFWSHEHILSQLSEGPDAMNVLFHIHFPSFAYIPIKELISLRRGEGDAFKAFQNALTKAVQEMIANSQHPNNKFIAARILQDVLNPELAKLRQRLHSAKRALVRKATTSVTLAGINTVCGLLLQNNPLAVIGGGFLLSGMRSDISELLSNVVGESAFLGVIGSHANGFRSL